MELKGAATSPGPPPPQASAQVSSPVSAPPPSAVASTLSPSPVQLTGGQARLTLKRGGALTTDSFVFSGDAVIGRFDADSGPVDIDLSPLPEAIYLSRRHAQFSKTQAGQWMVKDLGSQNGTFIRPAGASQFQRIAQDQPLSDGDEVAFGNARFEFHVG